MKIKINKVKLPSYKLKISRTIDGRIMITDHPDIDIVIIPKLQKIITFPKDEMSDFVYGSQDLFFDFLVKTGLIVPESVTGGSVYYSIEGKIVEPEEKINQFDMIIANIGKFLEKEDNYFKKEKEYKDMVDRSMYNPEESESTDLGDVPHEEYKGVIPRSGRPYAFGSTFGYMYE